MKLYCLIAIYFALALNSFSQTRKVYLNAKSEYIDNSKKAIEYILITKLSDTVYKATTYNLKDTIVSNGYYRDAALQIPNGEFLYYSKRSIPNGLMGILHRDTNTFISCIGYFTNGVRTGKWIEYVNRGVKRCSYNYQKGQLNGLFQLYDFRVNNYIREEGYYVNGKKEGDWNTFGYDTIKTPVLTKAFKNDKIIQTIPHIKIAAFSWKLQGYLLKQLYSKYDSLLLRQVHTTIIIDENGNVKEPIILTSVSPQIDALIIKTLINAPKFTPELHDEKPVKMSYSFDFFMGKKGPLATENDRFVLALSRDVGNGLKFETTELP